MPFSSRRPFSLSQSDRHRFGSRQVPGGSPSETMPNPEAWRDKSDDKERCARYPNLFAYDYGGIGPALPPFFTFRCYSIIPGWPKRMALFIYRGLMLRGGRRGPLPCNCTYLLDEDGRRASSEFLSLSCGNILTGEESFGRRCRHVEVSSSQALCLALV